MKWSSLLMSLMLLIGQAYADDSAPAPVDNPKAVITDMFGNPPPAKADLYGVLMFSGAKAVHGGEIDSVQWHVIPDSVHDRCQTFWDKDRGPLIVIPIGDKDVDITVIQFAAKGNRGSMAKVTVVCGHGSTPPPTPTPGPTPTPTPNPTPNPTPTDFKAKVTTLTASMTMLPAAEKSKVAVAFRTVASNIGTVSDPRDLLRKTADQMSGQLGLNAVLVWIPWRDKLAALVEAEKIPNIQAHAAIWNTIADVLEGK